MDDTAIAASPRCSGMRLTEQYACTWSQMDIRCRVTDLTKTKNGSPRTFHLNADALAAIVSVKQSGQKLTDPVFPREGAKARFDTRSWFQPCLVEAKIAGYVWHSNRHTYCSWLAMAGASIKEIQEAAGHKTITMSARYSHLSPEHKQSVVERVASAATSSTSIEERNRHQTKTATR